MPQSNENLGTSLKNNAEVRTDAPSAPTADSGEEQPKKKLSLAELFAEDDASDSENPEDNSEDLSKPVDSIDGLMKRSKLTAEQVYALKVPMPNGAEPMTIGQLKDLATADNDATTRELQFEQRRVKQEGELLRAQNELMDVLQALPKEHLTPAIIKKVRAQHEARITREHQLTLEHIPEWQDDDARLEDIKGINAFLSDYGFSEAYLPTIADHRLLKLLRDTYLRDKRIKKALAEVQTPAKRPGVRPSQKPSRATRLENESREKRSMTLKSAKLIQMFKS